MNSPSFSFITFLWRVSKKPVVKGLRIMYF